MVFLDLFIRDPRPTGTFDDFAKSVEDLMNEVISDAMLEEAVLGVIVVSMLPAHLQGSSCCVSSPSWSFRSPSRKYAAAVS